MFLHYTTLDLQFSVRPTCPPGSSWEAMRVPTLRPPSPAPLVTGWWAIRVWTVMVMEPGLVYFHSVKKVCNTYTHTHMHTHTCMHTHSTHTHAHTHAHNIYTHTRPKKYTLQTNPCVSTATTLFFPPPPPPTFPRSVFLCCGGHLPPPAVWYGRLRQPQHLLLRLWVPAYWDCKPDMPVRRFLVWGLVAQLYRL